MFSGWRRLAAGASEVAHIASMSGRHHIRGWNAQGTLVCRLVPSTYVVSSTYRVVPSTHPVMSSAVPVDSSIYRGGSGHVGGAS